MYIYIYVLLLAAKQPMLVKSKLCLTDNVGHAIRLPHEYFWKVLSKNKVCTPSQLMPGQSSAYIS